MNYASYCLSGDNKGLLISNNIEEKDTLYQELIFTGVLNQTSR